MKTRSTISISGLRGTIVCSPKSCLGAGPCQEHNGTSPKKKTDLTSVVSRGRNIWQRQGNDPNTKGRKERLTLNAEKGNDVVYQSEGYRDAIRTVVEMWRNVCGTPGIKGCEYRKYLRSSTSSWPLTSNV